MFVHLQYSWGRKYVSYEKGRKRDAFFLQKPTESGRLHHVTSMNSAEMVEKQINHLSVNRASYQMRIENEKLY